MTGTKWSAPRWFPNWGDILAVSEVHDAKARVTLPIDVPLLAQLNLREHISVGQSLGLSVIFQRMSGLLTQRGKLIVVGEWRMVRAYVHYLAEEIAS